LNSNKITVVGAGNVGATTAHMLAERDLGSIVLLDIVEGLAEGKAIDIAESGGIGLYESKTTGTTDWNNTKDSDIVVITSGLPRKPGMSRDDLLLKNVQIVKEVTQKAAEHSPNSIIIVVCNPLDAMVYTAAKISGFEKKKIIGMAGALDSARFCYFLASELGVSVKDVKAVLMGGHGDDMVPLPRFTSVNGIPISELLDEEKITALIERTRKGGIEIVNLLGYSAYYAPAAGTVKMVESILKDNKSVISCCAYCESEYSVDGYFVGVPVVLGNEGVEYILQLDLNETERAQFEESLAHVKQLAAKVDKLL
jgi:malate dehydrogenase